MKYSKSACFWRYEFDVERAIYHMCDETNGFCTFLALQLKAEPEKRSASSIPPQNHNSETYIPFTESPSSSFAFSSSKSPENRTRRQCVTRYALLTLFDKRRFFSRQVRIPPSPVADRSELDPLRLVGFVAQQFSSLFVVRLVISLEPRHLAVALEGEDVRGDAVQEPAVVADDDRAAAEIR